MASRLYDAEWVRRSIERLAAQVVAGCEGASSLRLALVGLQTRGVILAQRLAQALESRGVSVEVGSLDATMYRDDIHLGGGLKPMQGSDLTFDLNGATVVLVDDVMCTGRTIRAAIDGLFSFGRPAAIRLLVMLDRGGRELPIQPDHTGAHVDVPRGGYVRLKLSEIDGALGDAVYLVAPGEEEPA